MFLWLNKLLAARKCRQSGHRRGVRVADPIAIGVACATGVITYRCPRCGATWARKIRAKKEAK